MTGSPLQRAYTWLEPDEGKLSCPVLRGGRSGNASSLPDFDIPKASPGSAAQGIFEGVENGEEDIFPDPMSRSIADGWRNGVAKTFEKQYAGFVPQSAAI
jgi:hypothetical protein